MTKTEAQAIANQVYMGNGYMYAISELQKAYDKLSCVQWDHGVFRDMQLIRDELANRGVIY